MASTQSNKRLGGVLYVFLLSIVNHATESCVTHQVVVQQVHIVSKEPQITPKYVV